MNKKEAPGDNSGQEKSEKETVADWIEELDDQIKKLEGDLKFSTRQKGIDSVSLKELSDKLNALKLTRREYEDLLKSAK